MKHSLIFVFFIIALGIGAATVRADNGITVTQNEFTNHFPQNLTFQLEAQSGAMISQIALMVQVSQCASNRYVPIFTPDTKIAASFEWDLGKNYLPPGTEGQFWWLVTDNVGNQWQTPTQSFRVDDPSHVWQKLSDSRLTVYWYQGGTAFGQALFNRGKQAIQYLPQDIGVNLDQPVQIFIYASHTDLLRALSVGAQEWTGGQDFPEYSVVLIGIDPSNLDWGLSATAHELTHQVVHHAIQNGCNPLGSLSLPPLMDEGLAVYNENPGSPDPQFDLSLRRAILTNTLIPIRTLTSAFPADPTLANLSYGESWSFVDFLIRHYGKSKLGQWLQAVKQGGTIDDLFTQVYGLDLDSLEVEWRKDIGAQARVIPTRGTARPTPVPTFGLSIAETPVPGTASATATVSSVAVNATPAPRPTTTSNTTTSSLTNFCGGSLSFIGLGIIGTLIWQRHRGIGKSSD